jgi:serine/threonine protein kinase
MAIKQARRSVPVTRKFVELQNEVAFYTQLQGSDAKLRKLIVNLIETTDDESGLHLYLQLMERGSVKHLFREGHKLSADQIARYTYSVTSALKYLHLHAFIWNGCSAKHVLIDVKGDVKIAGFGLSRSKSGLAHLEMEPKDVQRYLRWMAPEIIKQSWCCRRSDIWSLGCFIVEMATGRDPHLDCRSDAEVTQRLVEMADPRPPTRPRLTSLDENLSSFLDRTFAYEISKRWTASKLVDHPFINRPKSSSMMTIEPLSTPLMG